MRRQRARMTAVSLFLTVAVAGCATTGNVNGQQTRASVTAAVSGQVATTVVITRTVVVTTTIFARASTGSSAPPVTSAATTTATQAPTTTSAVSTTAIVSPAAHATPTSMPGALAAADASTVTLAFLGALEKDPSGASSLQYLSPRLQAVVKSGHSVASIVGIQNMYTRYHADAAVSRGGGRAATVQATLTVGSGPIQRLFTLIPEGGVWRIDDIANNSA